MDLKTSFFVQLTIPDKPPGTGQLSTSGWKFYPGNNFIKIQKQKKYYTDYINF